LRRNYQQPPQQRPPQQQQRPQQQRQRPRDYYGPNKHQLSIPEPTSPTCPPPPRTPTGPPPPKLSLELPTSETIVSSPDRQPFNSPTLGECDAIMIHNASPSSDEDN
jgi:hypothetical protein